MPKFPKTSRSTLLVFTQVLACTASAHLTAVTVTSEKPLTPVEKSQGGLVELLSKVKDAAMEGNNEACLLRLSEARSRAKIIQAWLSLNELDCATKLKPSSGAADKIAAAIARVNANPNWLVKGPQAGQLRNDLIQAYLILIEADTKGNRSRAARSIEDVQDFVPVMDAKSKAKLWRLAGELAFVQQNTDAARELYRRSLIEEPSAAEREDLQGKIASLESESKPVKPPVVSGRPSSIPTIQVRPEIPKDESDLVDRVTSEMKSGDLVSACDDAIKILVSYPGSTRAKWATDRALDIYLSVSDKTDSKYALLKQRIVKSMMGADADRLAEWSRAFYSRGQYGDSFDLAKRALDSTAGVKRTAVLDLAAKAALASDRFSEARDLNEELIEKFAGTKESHEALFRAGLEAYRAQRFAEAQAYLERILSLPNSDNLELSARYWIWRSLEKTNSPLASAAADDLMHRFPFSYYGLRARIEHSENVLEWKSDAQKIESKIWLSASERAAWDRLRLLVRAGWLEEAQAELKLLPPPLKAEDKAVRGLLWAAAGQYVTASKLVNEAWDEKQDLRTLPFVAAAYPANFDAWITEQSQIRNLDRYLVKGLIKQESGYNVRAVSPSNALGLMQMIPPTAKEVATDLKVKAIDLPNDLFVPKRNIEFGTYYFAKLLNKYQGILPLALASYNAGPARIDRWLRARPSLKSVSTARSSRADDEIWFDEIPYAETSFYVKAILRNELIYKMLDQGRVTVGDPIWSTTDAANGTAHGGEKAPSKDPKSRGQTD